MSSKILYLICNAHLDPVWLWEWEEGAGETLSTFRTAAKFCEEFDDNNIICYHKHGAQWFFGLVSAIKRPCGQYQTLCYNLV